MSTKSISDDLRNELGALEGRQAELLAERDEFSYAAVVDRDPKSIKKLAAINEELRNIANQSGAVEAALKQAAKREAAAEDADRAKRRRADAEKAGVLMGEAEQLALEIDHAMAALKKAAVAYEEKMGGVRRLSGAGPQHPAVRAHLARAISAGLMGLPQHRDLLAPAERHSLREITSAWAQQIRNRISSHLSSKSPEHVGVISAMSPSGSASISAEHSEEHPTKSRPSTAA